MPPAEALNPLSHNTVAETSLTILVVDDTAQNSMLLDRYLTTRGHIVYVAENGEQGVNLFRQHRPDVVLMDVMMPGMDGYEATRQIKQIAGSQWVPVIFMSALTAGADQIKGLDSGGDDYLPKPVNLEVLAAKIQAMQRIAVMQKRLTATTSELQHYYDNAEMEQEMAQALMEKLVFNERLDDELLSVWHEPTSRFSGDLIAASRYDDERLYVLHADSTGHGLVAALPLLPISQVFYSMAEKGSDITAMVREMNRQLKLRMPVDRFVAATVLVYDMQQNSVDVWNGGNPPALCVTPDGKVTHEFKSSHLALGILGDDSFDATPEHYQCDIKECFFMYSDGVIEAENAAGEAFGMDGLAQAITTGPDLVAGVSRSLQQHLGEERAHDDVSLVQLNCVCGC